MQKRWSKAEIAHLERHASSAGLEELAKKFRTDTKTVERKLEELGLAAGGSGSDTAQADLDDFAKGVELLYGKKWKKAEEIFDRLAAEADDRQLADRARQSLEVCRRELASEVDGVDPYLNAVFEKNRGNLDKALELCEAAGKADEDERYAYLLASLHSLSGATDKALEHLETAIRLEPKNRVHAYHDPDFAELRGQDDFSQLVAGSLEP